MKYPNVTLKLWRLQIWRMIPEYYFEAGSKEGSAELFAIMNDRSSRIIADFKDPKHINVIDRNKS